MKPQAAAVSRPNRLLIALAAAWLIGSLAIGGAVATADEPTTTPASITRTTGQP